MSLIIRLSRWLAAIAAVAALGLGALAKLTPAAYRLLARGVGVKKTRREISDEQVSATA